MAEVATIYRIYGASPGIKYSLAGKVGRFCTQDADPGLNNPCKVPPTEHYDSFWVTDCLRITGSFNQVRDIDLHGDGNFAADWELDATGGGGLFVGHRDSGDSGLPIDVTLHGSNQYAQATGTVGTTGHAIDDLTNGHPYYKSQSTPKLNIDNCTAEAPLRIDSGPYTSEFYSKAWVLQLRTVPTSVYGAKPPKSLIVTYNIF